MKTAIHNHLNEYIFDIPCIFLRISISLFVYYSFIIIIVFDSYCLVFGNCFHEVPPHSYIRFVRGGCGMIMMFISSKILYFLIFYDLLGPRLWIG